MLVAEIGALLNAEVGALVGIEVGAFLGVVLGTVSDSEAHTVFSALLGVMKENSN